MPEYSITVPEGGERGIRVTCDVHGESTEFQPGYRRVAFHCEQCGHELEVALHDLLEWRDMGEMC
jgi:uncharacterized protein (DUF983 family)